MEISNLGLRIGLELKWRVFINVNGFNIVKAAGKELDREVRIAGGADAEGGAAETLEVQPPMATREHASRVDLESRCLKISTISSSGRQPHIFGASLAMGSLHEGLLSGFKLANLLAEDPAHVLDSGLANEMYALRDGEVEPNLDRVSQLVLEVCKEDVLVLMIHNSLIWDGKQERI
ncbi:hypothetical protein GH714_002765 [Hevea brasiliensis]|uniref:Uncharacterized protein n=1 Tax=Hevea brasiliensis TaxID=3981 RepID=A0A6A6KK54_HEVBR|nr:hypothetical protein GH714_002765 [Hevea brasiliensis]